MKKVIGISFIIFLITGCTTRISRPYISGSVYDSINLKPLEGVEILTWSNSLNDHKVEKKTNVNGYFFLPQKKYLSIMKIGQEAPTEFYRIIIRDSKYETKIIEGGGMYGFSVRDTVYYDTIYLKPK